MSLCCPTWLPAPFRQLWASATVEAGQCKRNLHSCSCSHQLQAIPKPQLKIFCLQGETASIQSVLIRSATFATRAQVAYFLLPPGSAEQTIESSKVQLHTNRHRLCIKASKTRLNHVHIMLSWAARSAWDRTQTTAVRARCEVEGARPLQVSQKAQHTYRRGLRSLRGRFIVGCLCTSDGS